MCVCVSAYPILAGASTRPSPPRNCAAGAQRETQAPGLQRLEVSNAGHIHETRDPTRPSPRLSFVVYPVFPFVGKTVPNQILHGMLGEWSLHLTTTNASSRSDSPARDAQAGDCAANIGGRLVRPTSLQQISVFSMALRMRKGNEKGLQEWESSSCTY